VTCIRTDRRRKRIGGRVLWTENSSNARSNHIFIVCNGRFDRHRIFARRIMGESLENAMQA
jgi:hypothetical protein